MKWGVDWQFTTPIARALGRATRVEATGRIHLSHELPVCTGCFCQLFDRLRRNGFDSLNESKVVTRKHAPQIQNQTLVLNSGNQWRIALSQQP